MPAAEITSAMSFLSLAEMSCCVFIASPKGILFFVAFLPQFIDPSISLLSQFVVMALTFVIIEFIYEYVVASLANTLKPALAKFGKRVNQVFGGVFIAIGVALPLRG